MTRALAALPQVHFRNGTASYDLSVFGNEANPDIEVLFVQSPGTGLKATLPGIGDGYHRYDMIFDPGVGSVSLFVDSNPTPVLSGYTGQGAPTKEVWFGSFDSGSTGQGNWSSVEFDVVPEPSTFVLGAIGAVGTLLYAPFRRRNR